MTTWESSVKVISTIIVFSMIQSNEQRSADQKFNITIHTPRGRVVSFASSFSGYVILQPLVATKLNAHFESRFYLTHPQKSLYYKGELVFHLSRPETDTILQKLLSQMKEAQAQTQFYQQLVLQKKPLQSKQSISREEWQKLLKDQHVCQACLDNTENDYSSLLNSTNWKEPFNGYISDIKAQQGQFVTKDTAPGCFLSESGLKLVERIKMDFLSLSGDIRKT